MAMTRAGQGMGGGSAAKGVTALTLVTIHTCVRACAASVVASAPAGITGSIRSNGRATGSAPSPASARISPSA